MHREVVRRSVAASLCIRTRPLPTSHKTVSIYVRPLSNGTTPRRAADSDKPKVNRWDEKTPAGTILNPCSKGSATLTATRQRPKASLTSELSSLSSLFMKDAGASSSTNGRSTSGSNGNSNDDFLNAGFDLLNIESAPEPPHHLHIYAHKHNTHITLTRPNRDPIISVSAGNIGFRKAGRSSYDAAYQLAAYVLGRIQEQGLLIEIKELEVVLRGWGKGREAVTKAILGSEGRYLRKKVVRVTDATRLKFGGTRSKKPRRLG